MSEEQKTIPPAPTGKKRKWLRKVLLILAFVFLAIQFIQPDKDNQNMEMTNDISTVVSIPQEVHDILKKACYDCHSNYTVYPWYSNIQPVGWWLKDHIDEGKERLNFSSFAQLKPQPGGRYATAQAIQDHKLEEVAETVEEGEMPLASYKITHPAARLSEDQKQLITNWVKTARQQLQK